MTDRKCENCVKMPTCLEHDVLIAGGCNQFAMAADVNAGKAKGNPKYDRTIIGKYGTGSCVVDVYRILDACEVTIPQLQHAAKKILFTGQRGHKDLKQDLIDILHSTQSALDMIEDKAGCDE